jgi:hypothetical protein
MDHSPQPDDMMRCDGPLNEMEMTQAINVLYIALFW